MRTFFNLSSSIGQSVFSPPTWQYAYNGLIRNLDQVTNYYRIRPFAVRSEHLLARILNNLGVPYTLNLERFYDIVDARSLQLSSSFKLTSSLSRGNVFNGVFFGEGSEEIIIASDELINPFFVYKNWRTYQSVKVIMHPKSDLGFTIPNGKKSGIETGIAVVVINIPALAVQFKAFLDHNQSMYLEKGQDTKTVAQFLHMNVLSNMVYSQLDIALFNRAYNYVVGAPMGEATKNHSFMLLDYSKHIDNTYIALIDFFKNNDRHYKTILKSFFTVQEKDFNSLFILPDSAPTKQILWSELVARIKVIEFLVKLSPSNGNNFNASENNLFLRTIKLYENDKVLNGVLSKESEYNVLYSIAEIKNLIK